MYRDRQLRRDHDDPIMCRPKCELTSHWQWKGIGTLVPSYMTESDRKFQNLQQRRIEGRVCIAAEIVFDGKYSSLLKWNVLCNLGGVTSMSCSWLRYERLQRQTMVWCFLSAISTSCGRVLGISRAGRSTRIGIV